MQMRTEGGALGASRLQGGQGHSRELTELGRGVFNRHVCMYIGRGGALPMYEDSLGSASCRSPVITALQEGSRPPAGSSYAPNPDPDPTLAEPKVVQSRAGETLEDGERQPPETRGGFSWNTASASQEQRRRQEGKEVLALPPGHRDVKGPSGTARFPWHKTPGLT